MPTRNLVKTCHETHLAHVYEHLYVHELYRIFDECELFDYLDYKIEGFTYGGYVLVEVATYNARAHELLHKVPHLAVPIVDTAVNDTMSLIAVEEGHSLFGDMNTIKDELSVLNQQPWVSLNDIGFFDTGPQSRETLRWHKFKAINVDSAKVRTKQLKCRLALESSFIKKNRDLLPLFHIIAVILQNNLTRELAHQYQYYYNNLTGFYTTRAAQVDYLYNSWSKHRPSLTTELSSCSLRTQQLFQRGILDAIVTFLENTDYNLPQQSSNEEELVLAMNLLVGAAGWRKLADIDKAHDIIKHTTFELHYGKQKQSFKLAGFLS